MKSKCYSSILLIFFIGYLGYKDFVSQKETVTIKKELGFAHASMDDFPMPICIKDTNNIVLYINKVYEVSVINRLGISKKDVIGKDVALFDAKNEWIYKIHNKEVVIMRKAIEFEEEGIYKGVLFKGKVLKYPVIVDSVVVAVGVVSNYLE